jgi:uncharacterized YigZ family protein
MSDEYKTIVGTVQLKLVVKKSRFFGLATSVDTIQGSKRFLALAQEKYPNASHYCYAYSIGWGREKREYATDAGEPRNSAGPPILTAVAASQLSNVICVVVRYYGGINLGIGGLIRAYGRCARECLASAKVETQIFYKTLQVRTPYEQIGSVLKLCGRLGGKVVNVEYGQRATAHLQIRQREIENFQKNLRGINADIDVIDPVNV